MRFFRSTRVSVFGKEYVPSQTRIWREKIAVGRVKQKFWKSWWFSPREKERSCQSFLRKEEFLPSMVAELGWAGSWEFVIFLDFRMVPDNLLLTVVFSVGDWSTVVSGPLPFIPSPIGVIVRAISRAPTQFANLFRSRVSVPRDFFLCSFHSWNGGPVKN